MSRNIKYEQWLIDKKQLWLTDEKKYQGKVSNFWMSPCNLDYYWHNKDSQKDCSDEAIKNSPGNRNPNYSDVGKRKRKFAYLIGQVCYVQDYNLLPSSIIYKLEKDERGYLYLLAKDRGTTNFYLTKRNNRESIAIWKDVITILKKQHTEDEIKHYWRLNDTIKKIETLIERGKDFSLVLLLLL